MGRMRKGLDWLAWPRKRVWIETVWLGMGFAAFAAALWFNLAGCGSARSLCGDLEDGVGRPGPADLSEEIVLAGKAPALWEA